MTTIVKGHGSRDDDEETFVAQGKKLRFYSGFDVDLETTVALIAIANGAGAPATETVVGSGKVGDVANYTVHQQDDEFIAKWLAMGGESGIPISWVGQDIADGTRFCTNPDTCNGLGEHTCSGVLGTVDDADIVVLACRGSATSTDSEPKYGTDSKKPLHTLHDDTGDFMEQILTLARTDVDKAHEMVDGLPQGSIALMTNFLDFDAWQKARHLSEYASSGDHKQFFGQLTSNEADIGEIMNWLDEVPSYGQAVDEYVSGDVTVFLEHFDKASDEVKEGLRQRAAVTDAETGDAMQQMFGDPTSAPAAATAPGTGGASQPSNAPAGNASSPAPS
jgi:hypothetical protein